jgi:hypothetical protein
LSLPPSFIHQGTPADAEKSLSGTTSKRSSYHSSKYKSGGELLSTTTDVNKSRQLDSARYVSRSSEQSRKSSISKSSGDQKSRESSKTSYSTNADLVPPSTISIPLGTLHGRCVQDRSEDESASRHLR